MSYRRETVVAKLALVFDNETTVKNIEKGIFNYAVQKTKEKKEELNWGNKFFTKTYSTVARKVIANLTYTPNSKELIDRIHNEEIKPQDLAQMTHQQMNPLYWAQLKEDIMAKYIDKTPNLDYKGMFRCYNCRSWRTTYTQVQTRSADEPMTTFVTCLECNKVRKF
jgi:DNA-directed RNA polymerase subunit M/transcription elongation factor TFIIS